MNTFNELGLPDSITQSLTRMGLVKPTEIQAQTIPLALEGNDILGSAQTGTGKTMAFTLPLVNHLLNNPNATALVLAPIREIAQQVMNALKSLVGDSRDFNTALIIGGEPYPKQLMQLKSRPRVVIGTPGRIIDHLERGTLRVDNLECLVLDETDRMFDMGFGIQLDHIISKLPTKRQTMMFSATIPPAIEKLAGKYLNEPKRVAVGSATLPIPKIKQEIVNISEKDKYKRLLQEIEQRDGTIIVFVKTKMNADRLAEALRKEDHSASAIHGDLRQHQREKVIRPFRLGKCRVMVATDIAARGLDIPHLMHVINYDVPPCPEDYIHRIGRTGRAGAEGFALCFVTSQDAKKWNAIERYMNPKAHEGSNRNSGSGSGSGFGRSSRSGSGDFGGKHPFANNDRRKPFAGKSSGESRGGARSGGFGSSDGVSRGGARSGGFGGAGASRGGGFGASRGGSRSSSFGDAPAGEAGGGESRGNSRGGGFGGGASRGGGFGGARSGGFGGAGASRGGGFGASRGGSRSSGTSGEGRSNFSKPDSRGPKSSFSDRPKSGAPSKRTFS
jgi:superfamily II DNA/RNA helicase